MNIRGEFTGHPLQKATKFVLELVSRVSFVAFRGGCRRVFELELAYAQSNLSLGDQLIFTLEVTDLASQYTQSVAVPAAYEGAHGNLLENVNPSFVILSCQQIESGSESTSAERTMDPALLTRILLKSGKNNAGDEKKMFVQVLEGPTHGKLRTENANNGYQFFAYDPDPGFLGKDQVSFLVQYNGKMYKQIRTIQVVEQANERENQEVCPIDRVIRTSRSTRTSKNEGVKP